jgi:hypothetical protein
MKRQLEGQTSKLKGVIRNDNAGVKWGLTVDSGAQTSPFLVAKSGKAVDLGTQTMPSSSHVAEAPDLLESSPARPIFTNTQHDGELDYSEPAPVKPVFNLEPLVDRARDSSQTASEDGEVIETSKEKREDMAKKLAAVKQQEKEDMKTVGKMPVTTSATVKKAPAGLLDSKWSTPHPHNALTTTSTNTPTSQGRLRNSVKQQGSGQGYPQFVKDFEDSKRRNAKK